MTELIISDDDFVNNPTRRVPVILLLDVSGSMNSRNEINDRKTKIEALNEGVNYFYDSVKSNPESMFAAEIAIVAFSFEPVLIEDFGLVSNKEKMNLRARGGTALGGAIELGLVTLHKRKEFYKKHGIEYYQPWMFILTDGKAGDSGVVRKIAPKLKQEEKNKKLSVYPIGIGEDADMKTLNTLSNNGALRLKGIDFNSLFEWLSQSIDQVSYSGDDIGTEKKRRAEANWADALEDL